MPSISLDYGNKKTIRLDIPSESLVAFCGQSQGVPLDDVVAAASASLADPLDFPAISEAVVRGDRIALALDRGLPSMAEVATGVLKALVAAGIEPQNITIVLPDGDYSPDWITERLTPELQDRVVVERHDSTDENRLAYLAASADGDPIHVNRTICDADMVIHVGCLRVEQAMGYYGIRGGVFPTFTDNATRNRFLRPSSDDGSSGSSAQQQREMEEAAWLLGARLTMQVVPSGGEGVLHIVSGDVDSVDRSSRTMAARAWNQEVPRRASLVIATITGGPEQQTWENFARALRAAMEATEQDGAIAICSELSKRPGAGLCRLMDHADSEFLFDSDHSSEPGDEDGDAANYLTGDALAADQLERALSQHRVFFLGNLDEAIVNGLGMAFVESENEIANLCRRSESCTIVINAQHAWPVITDAAECHG